jgi:hypothetical protein
VRGRPPARGQQQAKAFAIPAPIGLWANQPPRSASVEILALPGLIRVDPGGRGFVVETPGLGRQDVAAQVWGLDVRTDPTLLEHPTLRASALVLLGAIVVGGAVGALLCARREFHVKAPGKE